MFFKFEPILKQTIWGGERIATFKQINTSLHGVGESWELSGVPGNESVVVEGLYAGLALSELMKRLGKRLMGNRWKERDENPFPLLVKFIDASQDLSLQVHPNDRLAMQRHGCYGKTEMWYVVQAEAGASLYSGFSRSVTHDGYEAWVNSPDLMRSVAKYSLHTGDFFFVPAGRIHAIGVGAFVAEIQQTSDITYRLYDYGRLDKEGHPRMLHRAEAKEALDYRVEPDYRTSYTVRKNQITPLATCDKFTASLIDLDRAFIRDYRETDSFVILICVEGECKITDKNQSMMLRRGETILLSADVEQLSFIPRKSLKCLEAYI